jgi:hypothetical protein
MALADVGPIDDAPAFVDVWRQAFRERDAPAAIYSLEECAIALPGLLPDLNLLLASNDLEKEDAAVTVLIEYGEEGVERIAARFTEFSDFKKETALSAFRDHPRCCQKALPAVLEVLADSEADPKLRDSAAQTAFAIGVPSKFVTNLKQIRRDATLDAPACGVIDELLGSGREGPAPRKSKSQFASFLSPARRKQEIARLIEEVRTQRGRPRKIAVEKLAEFGQFAAPAIPELEALLREERHLVQMEPEPDFIENGFAQRAALETLAEIGAATEQVVPAVVAKLNEPALRQAAANTLQSLGPTAVPGLVGGLSNPYANTRCRCARILGEIGAASRSAVPALERAAKDPVAGVRGEATAALKRIRASTAAAPK